MQGPASAVTVLSPVTSARSQEGPFVLGLGDHLIHGLLKGGEAVTDLLPQQGIRAAGLARGTEEETPPFPCLG